MVEEVERALREAGTRIIDNVVGFLPGAMVLLVLIVFSLIVALVVRLVLLRTLRGLDFDTRAEGLGLSMLADWSISKSASQCVASSAYWLILLLGLLAGLTALNAAMPSRLAMSVFEYVPHVLAAAFILIVGGVLARFLGRAVLIGAVNMRLASARLLSHVVKWLVVLVAAAMALEHLGIGRTILLLAFGLVFGGIVLALALAIGLGAKDAVSRALEQQLRDSVHRGDRIDHV
jgi:hypothetical protein